MRISDWSSDVCSSDLAYSLRSGTQRVIGYLLKDEECIDGYHFRLETSKTVIASRLNLTPEHFSRILHDLCAHELIKVKGREVTILNVVRLDRKSTRLNSSH